MITAARTRSSVLTEDGTPFRCRQPWPGALPTSIWACGAGRKRSRISDSYNPGRLQGGSNAEMKRCHGAGSERVASVNIPAGSCCQNARIPHVPSRFWHGDNILVPATGSSRCTVAPPDRAAGWFLAPLSRRQGTRRKRCPRPALQISKPQPSRPHGKLSQAERSALPHLPTPRRQKFSE
jgi:hypothetical protein